jgi:nicotinamidase-related amidase
MPNSTEAATCAPTALTRHIHDAQHHGAPELLQLDLAPHLALKVKIRQLSLRCRALDGAAEQEAEGAYRPRQGTLGKGEQSTFTNTIACLQSTGGTALDDWHHQFMSAATWIAAGEKDQLQHGLPHP